MSDPAVDAPPSEPGRVAPVKVNQLKQWLPLYLSKADGQIAHLNRILSTPSGTDTTLLVLNYTLLLLSTQLRTLSTLRLRRAAHALATKASDSLLPGETFVATIATAPSSKLLRTSASFKALSDLIGDFRIFVRLWGLLGIWQWAASVVREPPSDGVLRGLAYAQLVVNTFYQGLENAAYLASKGVVGLSPQRENRYWLWSSRFWMMHVVLDLGRLYRVKQLRDSRGESVTEEEKEGKVLRRRVEGTWWRELGVNVAYAPLTLHWSLEDGVCGDGWVGALGAVAGVLGFRELWRETA
ncbi:MAG: hypothetical protein M1827_006201 [Pycnora praestabilis]|nr:MAG: hypothetical protein M1827_006201 [Pycnora praestabilis]